MKETRQQILQGKLSPIAYYMEKNIMDEKLLATYIGPAQMEGPKTPQARRV